MNLKPSDLDTIFSGTGAALNAAQSVCGAISSGINDVKNIVDNSRRNYPEQVHSYGSVQPVSYGYGYADNVVYNPYSTPGYQTMNNPTTQQPTGGGYLGFTDAGYGCTGSTPFGSNGGGFWR